MKNQEIITIEHKGITVAIKLDYDDGTCSLVEKDDNKWKTKQWVFPNRTLDYLDSWNNILEAMQVAVKQGKKLLENDLAEKTKLREDLVIKVMKQVNKK